MSKLKGKVVIVIGASKGIGAVIAKLFGAEGASVVVNYVSSREGADKVVAEIVSAGGKAVAVGADVSRAADAKTLVDAAIKNFGHLDIVVNNSGVYEWKPLEKATESDFHWMFNINVLGPLLATEAAIKHLGEGGSNINIGSGLSHLSGGPCEAVAPDCERHPLGRIRTMQIGRYRRSLPSPLKDRRSPAALRPGFGMRKLHPGRNDCATRRSNLLVSASDRSALKRFQSHSR